MATVLRIFLLIILVAVLGAMAVGGYFLVEKLFLEPEREMKKEMEEAAKPPPEEPGSVAWRELKTKLKGQDPSADMGLIQNFLATYPNTLVRGDALDLLTLRGGQVMFTDFPAEWKEPYRVVSGDSMNKVSTKQKASSDWILKINNLLDFNLQIGQTLLIPKADLRLIASRKEKRMFVLRGEELLAAYPLTFSGVADAQAGEATVKEKIASGKDGRQAFGAPGYADANKQIALSTSDKKGLNIAAMPEAVEGGATPAAPKGLLLAAPDLEEVFIIVKKGTPVVIE